MTTRRKRIAVVAIIAAVLLATVITAYVFLPTQPECMSVSEFAGSYVISEQNLGRTWCFRDTATSSEVVRTPWIDYSPADGLQVDTSRTRLFTEASFTSTLTSLFFLGDRTSEFSPGVEVEFQFEARRYDSYGSMLVMVEHDYVRNVLLRGYYQDAIRQGLYSPLGINASPNGTLLEMRTMEVNNSHPLPLNWSDVQLVYSEGGRLVAPNFTVRIEDENGTLLGELHPLGLYSRNPSLQMPVSVGQILFVPLDSGTVFDRIDVESDTWLLAHTLV